MAGTVTIEETRHTSVKKIKFSWTSEDGGDDAGKADGTTTYAYDGELIALVTVPDGDDAPTNNYDVVISDSDSLDVLLGQGADRSNVNTEMVARANLGAVAGSKLTLSIANAGNAKEGTVYVYLR